MIVPINHLPVEMTKAEHEYYQQLSRNLSDNGISISNQLRGAFEVDESGIIFIINPSAGKQIQWGCIVLSFEAFRPLIFPRIQLFRKEDGS